MPIAGWRRRISCAAWIPSSVCVGGMRMSTIATSGACASTAASSSSGSAAWATTSMSSPRRKRRDALAQQAAVVGDHDPHGSSAVTRCRRPAG